MAYLDSLKVVTAVKTNNQSPIVFRRNKLIEKLHAQIECAKAKSEGKDYFINSLRSVKAEDGSKTKVEHVQKIRQWWYRNADGKLVFEVRYANKRIELSKGKTGVEVENLATLIPAIELLMKAVESGELDKNLTVVTSNFRAGVSK